MEKYQMLIDLEKLNLSINGIIHVGAHIAEEYEIYKSIGCKKFVWVEANEALVKNLQERFKKNENIKVIEAVVSDKEYDAIFNVHNDTHTSSLLEMEKIAETHPELYVESKKSVRTISFDQLIDKHNIDMKDYNMLTVDVQGVELQVLNGIGETNLKHIDYILTEVETWQLYKDAKNYDEIKDWCKLKNFEIVTEHIRPWGWGDILFKK